MIKYMDKSYKNRIINNCSKITIQARNINQNINISDIYKTKKTKTKTKKTKTNTKTEKTKKTTKTKKTKICRVVLFYSDTSCDESF
jgi:hypothetical protein